MAKKTKSKKTIITPQAPPPPPVPQIQPEAPLNIETAEVPNEEVPLERKNKTLYFAGIISLIILVIILGLIFMAFKKERSNSQKVEITPVPTLIVPTVISFNPGNWTIEVLNGSQTAGIAKKAADNLAPLGFRIINIGNADKSNYKNVEVYLSPDLQKYESEFMEKIKSVYKEASVAGVLESSSPSGRIIIGR